MTWNPDMAQAIAAQRQMPQDLVAELGRRASNRPTPQPVQAKLHGSMGFLAYGEVRDFIWQMRQRGHNVRLEEGPGWLTRSYTVSGDLDSVRIYEQWLKEVP